MFFSPMPLTRRWYSLKMEPVTAATIAASRLLMLIGCAGVFTCIFTRHQRSGAVTGGRWLIPIAIGLILGPLWSLASPPTHQRIFDPALALRQAAQQASLQAEQETRQLADIGVSPIAVAEHRTELNRTRVWPAQQSADLATELTARIENASIAILAALTLFATAATATARRFNTAIAAALALLLLAIALITIASITPMRSTTPASPVLWTFAGLATFAMGWLAGLVIKPSRRASARTLAITTRYLVPAMLVILMSRATLTTDLAIGAAPAIVMCILATRKPLTPALLGSGVIAIATLALLFLGSRDALPPVAQSALGVALATALIPALSSARA